MGNARVGSLILWFVIPFAGAVLTSGCAPLKTETSSPLSNKELASATAIFIESDHYQLKTVSAEPPRLETSKSQSNNKPKPKPRKSKSVDVDFVLRKSKEISVGLAVPEDFPSTSYVQNENQSFVPASVVKLVTTAVALKVLGPEFRFSTRVIFDLDASGHARNVALLADGDPTAGVTSYAAGAPNRMQEIAIQLKARGVQKILGEIVFVPADPRWEVPVLAPGVPEEDARQCYGAFVTSFNFQGNCAQTTVFSNRGFHWESPGIENLILTRVETSAGPSTSLRLSPIFSSERQFRGYTVSGTYLAKKPRALKYRLPVGNGVAFYADQLRLALKSAGIGVDTATINFTMSNEARRNFLRRFATETANVFQIDSAPLSEIVVATNKSSDNFFAEALFRRISTKAGTSNGLLVADGKNVLSGFLGRWMSADGNPAWSSDFQIEEGAGLSLDNRATPRGLLAFLRQIAKEPTFSVMWDSLAVAGQDGTLGDRMEKTRAVGRVRAKTGTLKGVYQVAGYIEKKANGASAVGDRYVPFVILTATTVKNRDLVRRFQDALIVKMVDSVDRGEKDRSVATRTKE